MMSKNITVKDLCPKTLRWVAAKLRRDANAIERTRILGVTNGPERDMAWGCAEGLFKAEWQLKKLASKLERE